MTGWEDDRTYVVDNGPVPRAWFWGRWRLVTFLVRRCLRGGCTPLSAVRTYRMLDKRGPTDEDMRWVRAVAAEMQREREGG